MEKKTRIIIVSLVVFFLVVLVSSFYFLIKNDGETLLPEQNQNYTSRWRYSVIGLNNYTEGHTLELTNKSELENLFNDINLIESLKGRIYKNLPDDVYNNSNWEIEIDYYDDYNVIEDAGELVNCGGYSLQGHNSPYEYCGFRFSENKIKIVLMLDKSIEEEHAVRLEMLLYQFIYSYKYRDDAWVEKISEVRESGPMYFVYH